jgi:hypothetical protein
VFCATLGGSKASKACDVAVSCLEKMVMEYQLHHVEHTKDIATVVFSLLIIHPKVTINLLLFASTFYFPAHILTLDV